MRLGFGHQGCDLGLEACILTFDSWMEREERRRRRLEFGLLLGRVWAFRLDFVPRGWDLGQWVPKDLITYVQGRDLSLEIRIWASRFKFGP